MGFFAQLLDLRSTPPHAVADCRAFVAVRKLVVRVA